MDEIVSEFNKSLITDSAELLSDYIDLEINNALELENDIPIVKTIIGLGKIAIDIRERNLINWKALTFTAIFLWRISYGETVL